MISFTRLISTIKLDIKQQYRNGFYFVLIIVLLTTIVFLSQLPPEIVEKIFPIFILTNMLTGTYLFIGGLVLYERNQNIPDALIVTPLRPQDYVISKVVTLSLLTIIEFGLIILYADIFLGVTLQVTYLLIGTVLLALLYCLIGFNVVCIYPEFNTFMSKGIVIAILLSLPFINFFISDPIIKLLMLIVPTNSSLLIMTYNQENAFWQIIYLIISLVWIIIFYHFAIRNYFSGYKRRREER